MRYLKIVKKSWFYGPEENLKLTRKYIFLVGIFLACWESSDIFLAWYLLLFLSFGNVHKKLWNLSEKLQHIYYSDSIWPAHQRFCVWLLLERNSVSIWKTRMSFCSTILILILDSLVNSIVYGPLPYYLLHTVNFVYIMYLCIPG